jgi:hypothetical protein
MKTLTLFGPYIIYYPLYIQYNIVNYATKLGNVLTSREQKMLKQGILMYTLHSIL